MKILTNKERDEILSKLETCQKLVFDCVTENMAWSMIMSRLNDIAYTVGGLAGANMMHDVVINKVKSQGRALHENQSTITQTVDKTEWKIESSNTDGKEIL